MMKMSIFCNWNLVTLKTLLKPSKSYLLDSTTSKKNAKAIKNVIPRIYSEIIMIMEIITQKHVFISSTMHNIHICGLIVAVETI